MHWFKNWGSRNFLAGAALGALLLIAGGCGATDESQRDADATGSTEDVGAHSDELRWRHPRPHGSGGAASTSGGAATTGGSTAVNCGACTLAQDCCEAVQGKALCTYSTDMCWSMDAGRQKTYATNCMVLLRTTISAWTINGKTPPAACHLP